MMNSAQKFAIQANRAHLCVSIDLHEVIWQLRVKKILDKNTTQRIYSSDNPDDKSKALFLIELLENRDNGWEALLDALKEANQSQLVDLLENSMKKPTNGIILN